MRCSGIGWIILFSVPTLVHASVHTSHHKLNLKLFAPIIDNLHSNVQNDSATLNRYSVDITSEQRAVQQNHTQIKRYANQLKQYSQLKITDDFSVTVGSVKSAPLGAEKQQLVEIPDVLMPRMNQLEDDTIRGYGLKFKYNYN